MGEPCVYCDGVGETASGDECRWCAGTGMVEQSEMFTEDDGVPGD